MSIYKAPENIENRDLNLKSVFLAGSIEMNKATNWQRKCEIALEKNFHIFNPRRESWNSSWKQEITNPNFKEQVEWELNALEKADLIVLFFEETTKSPISLLEFGLFAKENKLLVVCQENFWRKGNIDIVCKKYKIPQFKSLDEVINQLKTNS